MSNYVRGGAGGPRQSANPPVQKTVGLDIEKAVNPTATPLQPINLNSGAADQGKPVGGLQDANVSAAKHRHSSTARSGQDPNAFATMALSMGEPGGMVPGQKSPAKAVPTAPPRLANASVATGPTSASGEQALRGHASLARNGGKLGISDVERHRAPAVPAPAPTFSSPNAEVPGGSPMPIPSGGGVAYGVMQGGKGQKPAGTADIQ